MSKLRLPYFIILLSFPAFGQTIDEPISQKDMQKDFELFKEIRQKANSGLYKYRTKEQIDSTYNWAENEINKSSTILDFYNILCKLTDFEGSCHNNTDFPKKYWENMRKESSGYFPYPIKWIDGKWRINFEDGKIPLGAEIISINQEPISIIIDNLNSHYTTDGINATGKRDDLMIAFSRSYRWYYGLKKEFEIAYKMPDSNNIHEVKIDSESYAGYFKNFNTRYSKPFDQILFQKDHKYIYKQINASTGMLTINTFSMGNETTEEHRLYCNFLDRVFVKLKSKDVKNLIVDVRQNGGGTDPNDLVTYSYLTERKFQENKEAWVSFKRLPLRRHIDFGGSKIFKSFIARRKNKYFNREFPVSKNDGYYQNEDSQDHLVRMPNKNAFSGQVYLLISPSVASAGSLFAAMVAGNVNTVTIGEETTGGYYGHNGHNKLTYKLPKSKIETSFSVVNLEQDVAKNSNQHYNRGIIPDHEVSQSYEDFLKHEDTQLNYVIDLINKN